MIYHKELGMMGQELAVEYLKENGYQIMDTNFVVRGGEMDIIAKKKEYYTFVEVKTRKTKKFGDPLEQISYNQQRTLIYTAQKYLQSKGKLDACWQIDVIVVTFENDEPKIEHVKNAINDL